jgi:hypothetical protein
MAWVPSTCPPTVLALRKINTAILRGDHHGAEETQIALTYDTYLRQEEGPLKEHRITENGGNLLYDLGTMTKNKTGGSLALQSHSSLRLWVCRNNAEHSRIHVYLDVSRPLHRKFVLLDSLLSRSR